METLNLPEDCVIAIEVQVVPSETERCEICGRPMLDEAGKHIGIGKERVLACLECRHEELLRKYRRLKRRTRNLQSAFAEVKYHLLYNDRDMKEKIIGICEAYRDRFDADRDHRVKYGD